VGSALNLCPQDAEREIKVLRRKLDAGADFLLTQPVYEPELARGFIQQYQELHDPLSVPIMVGVLPLYSARHAAFLHNEVPGIEIPASIQSRIAEAGDSAPEEGVRVAIELLSSLKDVVQGAYIMPAFSRYDLAAEIIEAFRGRK
jgi:homocysteine S-methyltransferase